MRVRIDIVASECVDSRAALQCAGHRRHDESAPETIAEIRQEGLRRAGGSVDVGG
jgi:hypothetical protein